MAEVFRARLEGPMGFEKELAIKRIHDSLVKQHGENIRALINEARIGGRLKHPNIIEVYELGQEDDAYFIAMELVDGPSLVEILEEARRTGWDLPRNVLLDIVLQVSKGLAYAHDFSEDSGAKAGVVHRDLKPSNIMITRGGTVKLMDFGIAKSATNLFDTTATGVAKGTPLYMSPEQLRGMRPLPTSSDLFSLGVILYEMVAGKLLFAGRTIPEIVTRVLNKPLGGKIAEVEERIPGLGSVLARLLDRDVASRIHHAREVSIELQHILEWQEKRTSTAEFVRDFMKGRYEPGGSLLTEVLREPSGEEEADIGADGEPRARQKAASPIGAETVVARYLAAQRRRRIGVAILGLLLVLAIASAGSYIVRGTFGVSLGVDHGVQALNEGDLAAALAAWDAVDGNNPNRQDARFGHAALASLGELSAAESQEILLRLDQAPEETSEQFVRKYRSKAWFLRATGEYQLAMTAQRDALERASQQARIDESPIPALLLWEAGELTLIRRAPDAARSYFQQAADGLPPGPLAEAAEAYSSDIARGNGPLLRAELLWLAGRSEAWEELDSLLDSARGSRYRLQGERLVWAYRALGEQRWELALVLTAGIGQLPGERERQRQVATVRAAAQAGLGKRALAQRQLERALRASTRPELQAASKLQVAWALRAAGLEPQWLATLAGAVTKDLGPRDPDVRRLLEPNIPLAGDSGFPGARRLSLDPGSMRTYSTPLVRGGASGARLVPADGWPRVNRSPGGLAWPFGPSFHPLDGEPLPTLFHPGR